MIPQPFIQELLARIDVVDVVGKHVKLRKAGANFVGLCPFHAEKTPSFSVSPSKQFYHCFGCGAHGSAIGFLMEHGGLSYVEAIGELAQSIGLEVPDSREGAPQRPAPGLHELMNAAARFYKQRLKDTPRAIDYLKRRGVTGPTAARFAIGYAPEGWRSLEAAVPDYADPALVTAGLVIDGEGDGRRRRYDRFRDRIMFPIRNPRGQIIGFGGRVLESGEPKYLNSPETPLFSKGREVYGLFEAREQIRAAGSVLVVEGYMDVVMLAEHGIGNAVATLGTATTPQHVHKLLRLVDHLVFAFDGDAAGRKAAWRALEASLPEAVDTKRIDFLFLPPQHDPDSYVREHGEQGFRQLLASASPLSEFLVRELGARVDLATPEGRAHLQAQAKPLLLQLPPAALRMQLIHTLARVSGIETAEFQRYLGLMPASSGWTPRAPRPVRPAIGAPDLVQRACLLVALHPALAREPLERDYLPGELLGWVDRVGRLPPGASFASLVESVREDRPERAQALERAAAADRGLLGDLALDEARKEFAGALTQLRRAQVLQQINELVAQGLQSEADRSRYGQLRQLQKALSSPEST
ncbi:MAG TPA: DNA primase [Burkholderiaceae bacterium]|nr:DNA primase [Burkholderiaceae bacterium]